MIRPTFQIIIISFLLLVSTINSQAQSKIIDAKIDWSPSGGQYVGQLLVYLTDTTGIAGEKIIIGSLQSGDSDLYQGSHTIDANGNVSGSGSLANNVLQTSIGTFAYHANYYAKVSILLSNGQSREIEIHSSN